MMPSCCEQNHPSNMYYVRGLECVLFLKKQTPLYTPNISTAFILLYITLDRCLSEFQDQMVMPTMPQTILASFVWSHVVRANVTC